MFYRCIELEKVLLFFPDIFSRTSTYVSSFNFRLLLNFGFPKILVFSYFLDYYAKNIIGVRGRNKFHDQL